MKYLISLLVIAFILLVVVMPVVGAFVPWAIGDYSQGARTGLINKISHKGLICKTYEGYLLVGNGQNVQPEEFHFTVKDEEVARQIEALSGKVATLEYRQNFLSSQCWGDTNYDVVGVTVAN